MGFFDKVLRVIEAFARSGGLIEPEPTPEPPGSVLSRVSDIITGDLLIRKFVAGVAYCGGQKQTAFALTFESEDIDREEELLNEIEAFLSGQCSAIRENRGYSEETGQDSRSIPRYPEIEVGFE